MRDGARPSQTGRGGEKWIRLFKRELGHIKNTRGEKKQKKQLYLTLCFAFQSRKCTERKEVKKKELNNGRDVKSSNFCLFTPEAAQIASTDAITGSIDRSLRQ